MLQVMDSIDQSLCASNIAAQIGSWSAAAITVAKSIKYDGGFPYASSE